MYNIDSLPHVRILPHVSCDFSRAFPLLPEFRYIYGVVRSVKLRSLEAPTELLFQARSPVADAADSVPTNYAHHVALYLARGRNLDRSVSDEHSAEEKLVEKIQASTFSPRNPCIRQCSPSASDPTGTLGKRPRREIWRDVSMIWSPMASTD